MELYQKLGFKENPFSRLSAEEEIEYLDEIFMSPRYYRSLRSDIKNLNSRFIFGNRGSGKSALLLKIRKDLNNDNHITVLIDRFDSISLEKNEIELLYTIIKSIIKNLAISLTLNKKKLKKTDIILKEKLSFLIVNYFETISKTEFEKKTDAISKYKRKNILKWIYNSLLNKPINIALTGSIEIASDLIRKSLLLPESQNDIIIKNYLPQLTLSTPTKTNNINELNRNYVYLKNVLNDLCEIIKQLGFNGTVVFFDKIDEFKMLEGNVNKIVNFSKGILNDTELLLNTHYAFVFSIWSEIKRELNASNVRFDKFKPIDISWTDDDLLLIISKRLKYFSKSTKNILLSDIITNPEQQKLVLNLAYNSPRDLILLLSYIYDEQTNENQNSTFLNEVAVTKATINFCKEYNYYSHYPAKKGTKEDIYNILNKLLNMSLPIFKVTDIAKVYKFSSQAGLSYIKIMKNYRLISEIENTGKEKKYEILDPKIVFLISQGIKRIK